LKRVVRPQGLEDHGRTRMLQMLREPTPTIRVHPLLIRVHHLQTLRFQNALQSKGMTL